MQYNTIYTVDVNTSKVDAKINALNSKWDALRAKINRPLMSGGVSGGRGGSGGGGRGSSQSTSDLSVGGMGGMGLLKFGGGLAIGAGVAYAAGSAAMELARTEIELNQYRRAMEAVSGNSYRLAQNFTFVDNTAKKYGKSLENIRETYKSFTAATMGTNIEGEKTRHIYESITRASTKLGLSQERYKLTMMAVSQIASKGCHGKGSLIRMYDGSLKKVEDIKVGDFLLSMNGEPREVIRLAYGNDTLYKVYPDGYEPFVVNKHHKLRVITENNENKTVVLKDIIGNECHLSLIHESGVPVYFSLENIGDGEFFGFLISDDHLYIDYQGFEHHNTVSMEEMRQQLGEHLPGSMQAMARGLGVTVPQLIAKISSGSLDAATGLDALAKGLDAIGNKNFKLDETAQSLNDMQNSWLRFKEGFGGDVGGFISNIATGLMYATDGLATQIKRFYDIRSLSMFDKDSLNAYFSGVSIGVDKSLVKFKNEFEGKNWKQARDLIKINTEDILSKYTGGLVRKKRKDGTTYVEDTRESSLRSTYDFLKSQIETYQIVGGDEDVIAETKKEFESVSQDLASLEFMNQYQKNSKNAMQAKYDLQRLGKKDKKETESGMNITARSPIVYNINIAKQVGIETVMTQNIGDKKTQNTIGEEIIKLLMGSTAEVSIMSNSNQ